MWGCGHSDFCSRLDGLRCSEMDLFGEAGDDACAQSPRALADIKKPTAEEKRKHALTHCACRRWCRWCALSRMPNTPHRWLPPFSRRVPCVVMDYCFVRCANDTELLTLIVAKLYPQCVVCACPCEETDITLTLPRALPLGYVGVV